MFWSDADMLPFVRTHFPDLEDTFQSYGHVIQRTDVFRLLVVYIYGGLYCDMDIIPLYALQALEHAQLLLMPSPNPNCGMSVHNLTNCFFAARRQHPFIGQMIQHLAAAAKNYKWLGSRHLHVMASTGPLFLSREFDSYRRTVQDDHIVVLPLRFMHEGNEALQHTQGASWHAWDSRLLAQLTPYIQTAQLILRRFSRPFICATALMVGQLAIRCCGIAVCCITLCVFCCFMPELVAKQLVAHFSMEQAACVCRHLNKINRTSKVIERYAIKIGLVWATARHCRDLADQLLVTPQLQALFSDLIDQNVVFITHPTADPCHILLLTLLPEVLNRHRVLVIPTSQAISASSQSRTVYRNIECVEQCDDLQSLEKVISQNKDILLFAATDPSAHEMAPLVPVASQLAMRSGRPLCFVTSRHTSCGHYELSGQVIDVSNAKDPLNAQVS